MKDRRNFSRLKVNMPVSIFLPDSTEVSGFANDISEQGINITLTRTDKELREGDIIILQFVDRLNYEVLGKSEVIVVTAHVLRTDIDGENIRLGCIIQDEKYEQYVTRKKIDEQVAVIYQVGLEGIGRIRKAKK